jgi:hypothetical protein
MNMAFGIKKEWENCIESEFKRRGNREYGTNHDHDSIATEFAEEEYHHHHLELGIFLHSAFMMVIGAG